MTKIVQNDENSLREISKIIEKELLEGDLQKAENILWDYVLKLYGEILVYLLNKVGQSLSYKKKLVEKYESEGVSDLRLRSFKMQIKSGEWIEVKSYYARFVGDNVGLKSRHLSKSYWSLLGKVSMAYGSILSAFGVMSCSFEIGNQLLGLLSIKTNVNRIRKVATAYGEIANNQGVKAILGESESLAGKRVVIGFDGGRSRMREAKSSRSKKGYLEYETPWREPKIMVIQVLNEKGELEKKKSLPLYLGTLKTTKQAMGKLKAALKEMKIKEAKIIQFIADGARAIWKWIKPLFRQLKIPFSKIVLTLDYYHAVEHLKDLSKMLPSSEKEQQKTFEKWKADLWDGFGRGIVCDFKKRIKQSKVLLTKEMKTALDYFYKHHDHMQYKKFKQRKLLCGSGLVESAVRRIINLRFKGSSSFWKQDNLEKLIFLRCAFLANRWHNLLKNTTLHLKKAGTV